MPALAIKYFILLWQIILLVFCNLQINRLDRDLADVVMFLTFHRKDGSNKRRPIFLEHKCWRLLLDLLVSDGLTPGSTIVHTKLLTVISMIFNATFTEILDGTKTESQQELLSTANKVLDLLLTKFESGFKPTFEQFGQFVGDMVKVEGFITATNASDYLGGAIEAYLGVLERSLDEFAHQLVDQPNQKKVSECDGARHQWDILLTSIIRYSRC
jgi:hypothetical protein